MIEHVAGEDQGDLAGRGVQADRDGRQDRVDQADAHEGDHGREGDRPHSPWLGEERPRLHRGVVLLMVGVRVHGLPLD